MAFYDTHAHLDYPDYANDLEEVVARAEAAGIIRIVSIGTDAESSRRAIALSEKYPSVYAVVGWHPCNVLDAPDEIRTELRQLAAHPRVVAIGETGLDFHKSETDKAEPNLTRDQAVAEKQLALFSQHLEVASELGLNCVVHQRDAFEPTLKEMERWKGRVRGVFHCFVNGAAEANRILSSGSLVSFTGIATFKNAQSVRDTIAALSIDRFMLETDCPYLAPVPYRGKRCEPSYVREIAQTVADVKKCSLAELGEATCAAADEFFRFKR
jgi:TatD DNase family protein